MVDGSYLFSCIREITKEQHFTGKILDINLFTDKLVTTWLEYIGTTIRINFYFKKRDPRLEKFLSIPTSNIPGQKDHWKIIECGVSLKTIPEEELEKLSPEYRDYYPRAEKGVNIKLTCDSLIAITRTKISNIVFMLNDKDYIPYTRRNTVTWKKCLSYYFISTAQYSKISY